MNWAMPTGSPIQIGARLGVSKQAARKRFTDTVAPTPVLPPGVTLRPRLQTCLAEAGRLAQQTGAAAVGTEHLIAGLLADGVAAAILDAGHTPAMKNLANLLKLRGNLRQAMHWYRREVETGGTDVVSGLPVIWRKLFTWLLRTSGPNKS
jgi:hypothetical protein